MPGTSGLVVLCLFFYYIIFLVFPRNRISFILLSFLFFRYTNFLLVTPYMYKSVNSIPLEVSLHHFKLTRASNFFFFHNHRITLFFLLLKQKKTITFQFVSLTRFVFFSSSFSCFISSFSFLIENHSSQPFEDSDVTNFLFTFIISSLYAGLGRCQITRTWSV